MVAENEISARSCMWPPLLLCLLAILSFWSCSQRTECTNEVSHYDDPTIYEPVDIHYSMLGRGDTTLLFIHGLNLDETFWANQVPEFSNRYKIVTVDLAGHGKSPKNREHWTIPSFAKDIIRLIENEHLVNIILVGHSMGGDIALEVADSIPSSVIGIIGVDNFKDLDFKMDEKFEEGLNDYIRQWRADYENKTEQFVMDMLDSATDHAVAQRIIQKYQQADPDITLSIFKNLFPALASGKGKLAKLRYPLRLIVNDHPPYGDAGWKKYLPQGYSVRVMKHTGHFPMVERPAEFNQYLKEMLTASK
jgi:sigma-B regulation protein RsbQ